jgi:hypothetical protein
LQTQQPPIKTEERKMEKATLTLPTLTLPKQNIETTNSTLLVESSDSKEGFVYISTAYGLGVTRFSISHENTRILAHCNPGTSEIEILDLEGRERNARLPQSRWKRAEQIIREQVIPKISQELYSPQAFAIAQLATQAEEIEVLIESFNQKISELYPPTSQDDEPTINDGFEAGYIGDGFTDEYERDYLPGGRYYDLDRDNY